MFRRACFGPLAALVVATGCNLPFGNTSCTHEARAGLVLRVRDATTGAPIGDAIVVARRDAVADTLRAMPGSGDYAGAYEAPGTWSVSVERQDYRPWARDGVRVRDGECHVETRTLDVRLQRAP